MQKDKDEFSLCHFAPILNFVSLQIYVFEKLMLPAP